MSDGVAFGIRLGGDLDVEGTWDSWAAFSPDRRYRYALGRGWNAEAPWFVAVGLNPSTADASQDDPTVRRLLAFARRERCGTLLLVNAFALRATDPLDLVAAIRRGQDPVGPHNNEVISIAARAPMLARVVAAWGAPPRKELRHRLRAMVAWPRRGRWECLGQTKGGHPRHPLYLPATASIVPLGRAA